MVNLQDLNASIVRLISRPLERDPECDLTTVLSKANATYTTRRSKAQAGAVVTKPPKPTAPSLPSFAPSARCNIVVPLSSQIHTLLDISDEEPQLAAAISSCISHGKVVFQRCLRFVVLLDDKIIVKLGQGVDADEAETLRFLEQFAPDVPAPRCHGCLVVGTTTLIFMTFVAGQTLESRWATLAPSHKADIRRRLDDLFTRIRATPYTPSTPLGCPSGRKLCTDIRRHVRTSPLPIYNQAEFNDFLTASASRTFASPGYRRWVRSMLKESYAVVFTHGDFHPRNIMVTDGQAGELLISGVIDWEAAGFYPEYWEQLKAFNTRSVRDDSDWWDHLPPCITGYDREVVVDTLVESTLS